MKMILILILILLSNSIYGQNNSRQLESLKGYSIISTKNSIDTILSYQIEYDSLGRKSIVTNYPIYDERGISRITKFSYIHDTIIELDHSETNDTFKVKISLNRNNQNLLLEEKAIGWWTSGKYRKSKNASIRKMLYDSEYQVKELLFFVENSDTSYHIQYEYKKSDDPFYVIQIGTDLKTQNRTKFIRQSAKDISATENCFEGCAKVIHNPPDTSNLHYQILTNNIYIENGDTTSIQLHELTQLPNNYKTITRTSIYYNGQHSHKTITYYKSDKSYLTEKFGWNNNEWTLNAKEEYSWNGNETRKSIKDMQFRAGEISHINESIIVYKYK